MHDFISERVKALTPYTPGEQPQDRKYVKLNTNESPYPPAPGVADAVRAEAEKLRLYSDPENHLLVAALAESYGLSEDEITVGNGSDELLNFAFIAFCDQNCPALFPDITYGFYPVFASVNGLPFEEIPLNDALEIDFADYQGKRGTVFLANPNAPTGIARSRSEIESFLKSRPDSMLVVDEAYVDFGAESMLPLIREYDNLLVIQTFSKSRSLAGARLGFAAGAPSLIRALNTLRYSTNPYNVNRMTSAAGVAALREQQYYNDNCARIMQTRAYTAETLRKMGFILPESRSNFLFARHPAIGGEVLYRGLKEKGVLVRHFAKPRTEAYIRVTIGTREEMEVFLKETEAILAAQT